MPVNLLTAEWLDLEQVQELLALDIPLHLPAIQRLQPHIAAGLAEANHGIVLRNLRAITVAAAEALAPHKWGLHLTGLVSISREVGDALAHHVGPLEFGTSLKALHSPRLAARIAEQSEGRIRLDGLESLSPEVARALAYLGYHNEPSSISLRNLRFLSAETAAELTESVHSVSLPGLSDGRCILGEGAGETLSAAAHHSKKGLHLGSDIAAFLSRDYPERLLAHGIRTLNYPDGEYGDTCRHLDLSSLTTLSLTQARAISEFDGRCVDLSGLERIDPDVVKELAALIAKEKEVYINPKKLTDPVIVITTLRGLGERDCGIEWRAESISPEAAAALSTEEAAYALQSCGCDCLLLPSLRALCSAGATALAATPLPLCLDGLTELSPPVARALATHRGPSLRMNGLRTISEASALELAAYQGSLRLDGIQALSSGAAAALSRKIAWPT